GFALRDHLPPTYPHILAFPLHMAVMADGSFPFGAVGLVHIENGIVQHRPIGLDEELSLRVRPTKLQPHPRGRSFAIVTEVRAGSETVGESPSPFWRRGGGETAGAQSERGTGREGESAEVAASSIDPGDLPASGEWRLPGDLGRRYGAVSGDRNPIHM